MHRLYTVAAICVSTYTVYNKGVERFIHLCNYIMGELTPQQAQILEVHKQMDEAFIKQFCQEGTFLGEDGKEIHGVCRPASADEVLTFMHRWNAVIVEVIKAK